MTKKKQTAKAETKKTSKAKAADPVTTPKAKNAAPVAQAEAPAVQPVNELPAAQPTAAPTNAPRASKADQAPKAPREERNGVRRPREGGKCWQVWNHLDQHGNMEAKDLREVAAAKGWNVNNALIELSIWRKFMGITKPKPVAK